MRTAYIAVVLIACQTAAPPSPPSDPEVKLGRVDKPIIRADIGEPCREATDCNSFQCFDGICCDAPCGAQCQACNTDAAPGTCVTVTGAPRGARPPCSGGDGACGGTCGGTDHQACVYPSAGTLCGAACDGTCDGEGRCELGDGNCALGYACVDGACASQCDGSEDCAPHFACNGSSCVRASELDCLDGSDDNGDGLADCEDPTCNALVECVPVAEVGKELGYLSDDPCIGGYGAATDLHQGLQQGTACSGCACHTRTSCGHSFTRYTTNADCTGPSWTYSGVSYSDEAQCRASWGGGTADPVSVRISATTSPTGTCIAEGSAIPPPATWSTNRQFCAATRTSATCSLGAVCVAKRSAAPMCQRAIGTAACGGDYPLDGGVFYRSFSDTECTACPTSCSVLSTGTCSGIVTVFTRPTTCDDAINGIIALSEPTPLCVADAGVRWGPFEAVQFEANDGTGGTCSISQTSVSVAAAPKGANRVCCRN